MRKYILLVFWFVFLVHNLFSQEVIIGKDDIGEDIFQSVTYNEYSYTQAIYNQKWIHAEGDINQLSFYLDYSEGPQLDLSIYIGCTEKEAFAYGLFLEDYVPIDQLKLVFSGIVDFPDTTGWVDITLDSAFYYNNVENLVVAIDRNSGDESNISFACSNIDSGQVLIATGSPSDIDLNSPHHNGLAANYCPNIKLAGNLSIDPYLYVYQPYKLISTTADSSVIFDIETNQQSFKANCTNNWLSVTADTINHKISIKAINSSENLSEWVRIAQVILSSDLTENDTAYVNQYRFEPKEMKAKSRYFADIDNDNDLDLVGNGLDIIRNNGNDQFTVEYNYDGIYSNSVSYFADYDYDGDLDFLYKSDSSKIFKNDGNGNFSNIEANIEQLNYDESENSLTPWCDFDNDGDLDLLLWGMKTSTDPEIYLYRNEGDDLFIKIEIDVTAVHKGSINWIDYDNDGYSDIMVTGSDINGSPAAKLYKNNGSEDFLIVETDFPKLYNGKFDWGDYDSDGDQDLIICGSKLPSEHHNDYGEHKIFRNDNGSFTDIHADLQLFFSCFSRWVDFDNDGDLDIITHGFTENYYSKEYLIYYENIGNDCFSEVFRTESIDGVHSSAISLGNYDQDGDVDFILEAKHWEDFSEIYRNNLNHENTKPSPPTKLSLSREGTITILHWNSGTDNETPSKGLKYNIRLGTSPGKSDVIRPCSDLNTGFLKMPNLISCKDTFKIIEDLPVGTYYYSVQTIDHMLTASEFSTEKVFVVKEPFSRIEWGDIKLQNINLSVGDYDRDGDYDFIVCGSEDWWTDRYTKIYTNNGDSTFSIAPISLNQLKGQVLWGDYDNDNDLDILLVGEDNNDVYKNFIYRNDGNGSFTEINIDFCEFAPVKWCDIDNDGDLDVVSFSRTYINKGNDSFMIGQDYNTEWNNRMALADYDKDNDMDIIVTDPETKLYNNQTGEFIETDYDFIDIGYASIKWLDYNNDDYLDFIITGQDSSFIKQTVVYEYNPEDEFTRISPNIRAIISGDILSGDYNGDGYSDIVLAGTSSEIIFKVYEKSKSSQLKEIFSDSDLNWADYNLVWIDYNNDGHLDILSNYNIYSNNSTIAKETPKTPINLISQVAGFDVTFSWNKPESNSNYSYNLRVGKTPGGTEIVSPMADVNTGKRLILQMGNVQLDTSWIIKNLEAGQTYYWSVQAIDNSFAGGQWAEEQSFTMPSLFADFVSDTVCEGAETHFTDLSQSPDEDIVSWEWSFGDGGVSSEQNPAYTYTISGTFNVSLTINTATHTQTVTKEVIVYPTPIADFGFEIISLGQHTPFTNLTDTNNAVISSWNWNFGDGSTFNDAFPEFHKYSETGTYNVTLTVESNNGCSSTITKKVDVCLEALPKPDLYAKGPTVNYLACSNDSASYYKWYTNGELIEGADKYIYVASKSYGTYHVEISSDGLCYTPSDPVNIGLTDIDNPDPFANLKIYPNPTPGVFTIEMDNQLYGELITRIFNTSAVEILNIKFDKSTRHFKAQVDLSGQGRGIYIISLMIDKYKTERKLVVE